MAIDRISFVGVDEQTDLNMLNILAKKSLVRLEFGILFSESKNGKENRYPTLDFQKKFAMLDNYYFSKSLHICGKLASEVITNDPLAQYQHVYKHIKNESFDAIQINFGLRDNANIDDLISNLSLMASDMPDTDFVIQSNKSKKKLVDAIVKQNRYNQNIRLLHDSSGGFGKEINEISFPYPNIYTGYAGGINPDNITSIANKVETITGGVNVYIDMESGIRTNDQFSIKKCYKIIEAVNKIKENKLLEY